MEKLRALFIKYKEIIIYIIVGGMTTLVRWGTVVIFEKILMPFGMSGQALSFFVTLFSLIVTILFAFPPNKIFVFESRSFKGSIIIKEFGGFLAARAISSIIELAGIPLLSQWLGIATLWVTMIVSVVVLVANYIFSKLIVFKNRTSEDAQKKERKKLLKKAKKEGRDLDLKVVDKLDEKDIKAVNIGKKDKLLSVFLNGICALVFVLSVVFYVIDLWGKLFA